MTELSTLSYRTTGSACSDVIERGKCVTSAGDAHSYSLWLIAALVLLFAVGAATGRSRPAAVALIACGAAVLVIALVFDLPGLDDTRGLDVRYAGAKGHAGTAFKTEIVAGVLLVLVGGLALMRGRSGEAAQQTREERRLARERSRAASG